MCAQWNYVTQQKLYGKQELMMSTQGSNIWYGKIKAEGGPSAVNLLQCTDSEGDTFTGTYKHPSKQSFLFNKVLCYFRKRPA